MNGKAHPIMIQNLYHVSKAKGENEKTLDGEGREK